MPNNQQNKPVESLMRAPIARGLAEHDGAIDPSGGKRMAGIIRGLAVVTRGEALGHGYWLDETFVSQTSEALNRLSKGAKSRFTHPSLSGSGLGKFLGRTFNARQDGDILRADLHFSQTAHSTPEGDLAQYVMDLAAEDPEAFGTSIVFIRDFEAEEIHYTENGGSEQFQSPDPLNTNNLPHVRLEELRAVDVVDDPAANPSGMFHRDTLHADAESLLDYVTGESTDPPQLTALSSLDIEPNRITNFVKTYLDQHGLEIIKKDKNDMTKTTPKTNQQTADQQQNESLDDSQNQGDEASKDDKSADDSQNKADDKEGDDQPTDDDPPTDESQQSADKSSGDQQGQLSAQDQCKRYVEAFGAQGGVWFSAGLSFEEAQKKNTEALKAENEQLRKQIELGNQSEDVPLSSGEPGKGQGPKTGGRFEGKLTDGQARYAESLKLTPSRN